MAKEYSFLTTWKLEAPGTAVWDAIHESLEWPRWWKGIRQVEELEKGDERGINSIRRYTFRTPFLYTLSFTVRVTDLEDLSFIKGIVGGELEGTGDWVFKEEAGITTTQCHWRVATTVKWMNAAAFILAPLFRINHTMVMNSGAKALAKKLNARLLSCTSIDMK